MFYFTPDLRQNSDSAVSGAEAKEMEIVESLETARKNIKAIGSDGRVIVNGISGVVHVQSTVIENSEKLTEWTFADNCPLN